MHRLLVLIALLLVILETPVLAQEDEEEPLPPPRRHMQTKIGGGGGFTQNLLFLDLDPINSVLSASKATPFDKVPLVLLGGEGYGYILVVPNLRIGGLGASGSMNTKSVDTSVSPGISRDIDLSVGFGGVTIGYVVPVMPRLDVAFGVMLGGGNLTIKSRLDHGTPKLWGDLWDELKNNTPAQDYTRKFTGTFFMYQPSVNVEFAVLRWLGLRVGASYNGMAGNNWKLDDNDQNEVVGVPSSLSGKGWMLNGGVFLGTFVF